MTKVRWVLIAKAALEVRGLHGRARRWHCYQFNCCLFFLCAFCMRNMVFSASVSKRKRNWYWFERPLLFQFFLFYYDDPWAHGITFAFFYFFNQTLFWIAFVNGEPGTWTLLFVVHGDVASIFVSRYAWLDLKINSRFHANELRERGLCPRRRQRFKLYVW